MVLTVVTGELMSKEKEEAVEVEGVVTESLRGRFRVQLDSGHQAIQEHSQLCWWFVAAV